MKFSINQRYFTQKTACCYHRKHTVDNCRQCMRDACEYTQLRISVEENRSNFTSHLCICMHSCTTMCWAHVYIIPNCEGIFVRFECIWNCYSQKHIWNALVRFAFFVIDIFIWQFGSFEWTLAYSLIKELTDITLGTCVTNDRLFVYCLHQQFSTINNYFLVVFFLPLAAISMYYKHWIHASK